MTVMCLFIPCSGIGGIASRQTGFRLRLTAQLGRVEDEAAFTSCCHNELLTLCFRQITLYHSPFKERWFAAVLLAGSRMSLVKAGSAFKNPRTVSSRPRYDGYWRDDPSAALAARADTRAATAHAVLDGSDHNRSSRILACPLATTAVAGAPISRLAALTGHSVGLRYLLHHGSPSVG